MDEDVFGSSGDERSPEVVPIRKPSALLGDSSGDEYPVKQNKSGLLGSSSEDDHNEPHGSKNGSKRPILLADSDDDNDDDLNRKIISNNVTNLLGDDSEDDMSVEKVPNSGFSGTLLGDSSDEERVQLSEKKEDVFGTDDDEESHHRETAPRKNHADPTNKKQTRAKAKKPVIENSDDEFTKLRSISAHKPKEKPALQLVEMTLPHSHQIPPGYESILLRLPNFLGIDSTPFSADEYRRPRNSLETVVIRCKKDSKSNNGLLSNAKLLKWDDGTYQLIVADQVFDAKVNNFSNSYVFEQEKAILSSTSKETTVLECNGSVSSKITISTSLRSESHAKMSITLLEQYKKKDKIEFLELEGLKNPDQILHDLSKREEEEIRKKRKEQQNLAESHFPSSIATSQPFKGRRRGPELSSQFVEEEDEYDPDGDFIVNSDEEDGDENMQEEVQQKATSHDIGERDNLSDAEYQKSHKRSALTSAGKIEGSGESVRDRNSLDEDDDDGNMVRQPKRAKQSKFDSDSE